MAVSLHANRFSLNEFKHNVWSVVLEAGTSFDAVFQNDFWAHVAAQLRPGDIIQVRNDENTLYAELYVRGAGRLHATVSEISRVDFADQPVRGAEPELFVKWAGPHHKHSVFRRSDKERLQSGFDTPEEAARAMIDLSKTLAA